MYPFSLQASFFIVPDAFYFIVLYRMLPSLFVSLGCYLCRYDAKDYDEDLQMVDQNADDPGSETEKTEDDDGVRVSASGVIGSIILIPIVCHIYVYLYLSFVIFNYPYNSCYDTYHDTYTYGLSILSIPIRMVMILILILIRILISMVCVDSDT
jgi:hypothetical protein